TLTSIFVGGGTPSLWAPRELGRVLRGIVEASGASENIEITVECNPSSLTADHARALADEGVNRLSIGVQSLDHERLRFLGRLHDPEGALAAVEAALASPIPRVSADLMYGVAGDRGRPQPPEEAAADADRLAALGIEHVSAYGLTIEPNTRFGELDRNKRLVKVEDDVMARSFEAVGEALWARGLRRYEVSNYGRPGAESRHNLGYWRGDDYLGLGCAAFGTVSRPTADDPGAGWRYRNAPNPERYLGRASVGDFAPHEQESLSGETRLRERIMLGLRLAEGIDLDAAAAALGVEPWPEERRRAAEQLVERGRLVIEDGTLRVPEDAWLFADGTAVALF
ncbi:MAG TPA: coproporphyrinogen III oxidase family protein, partial [Polyangiaceae bacterium]|nr:coproporphyrinogen III oxidase family protein [Polyangiaceae bacterium]